MFVQLAALLLQLLVLLARHTVKLPQQPFQLSAFYAVTAVAAFRQHRSSASACTLHQQHRPFLQLIQLPDKLLHRHIRQLTAQHHGIAAGTLLQPLQQLFPAAKAGTFNGASLFLQIALLNTEFLQIIACKGNPQLGCSLTVHTKRRLSLLPGRQPSAL